MKTPFYRRESLWFLVVAFILLVALPVADIYGGIDHFTLNTWGKYLCYAVLAISVDMLWGYTGLLSLGQCLFFSLGGYMMGMYLMLGIGKLGQYKSDLPDFMVFLGHTFLPAFWRPFYSFGFALLMVFLVSGIISTVFGYLGFRSRIKGVYFAILTQALTYGAALIFFQNEISLGALLNYFPDRLHHMLSFLDDIPMGGNNGFTDFRSILGFDLHDKGRDATMRGLFMATGILLLAVYALCRWLTKTKFGLVQRAVRDSENRVLFSGYAAANYKLFVFVLAAVIASLGGALYVPQVGIINPSEMIPEKSLEAVIWVAVGGRGTLVGPVIGAVVINAMESWATRAYPDLWLIILGVMIILIVLLMPKGIAGLPAQLMHLWKRFATPRRSEEGGEDPPPTAALSTKSPDSTNSLE